MRLYLIRHPEPVIDTGVCYGSTDLPVWANKSADAANRLRARLPRGVPLFASPLQRCAGFARLLAEQLDSNPLVFDPRLVEMDFGKWEGRHWDDIGRAEIDAWCSDRLGYRPGGGETVLDVVTRVTGFYHELQRRELAETIVVCHAGTIRILQACTRHTALTKIGIHAFEHRATVGYGEMAILDIR